MRDAGGRDGRWRMPGDGWRVRDAGGWMVDAGGRGGTGPVMFHGEWGRDIAYKLLETPRAGRGKNYGAQLPPRGHQDVRPPRLAQSAVRNVLGSPWHTVDGGPMPLFELTHCHMSMRFNL
jgi:hypothetical protein